MTSRSNKGEKVRSISVAQINVKKVQRVFEGQFSEPAQLSSSILQHSITQLTFAKAERFAAPKMKCEPSMLNLGSTVCQRSTSFGFGNKMTRPLAIEKRDLTNPAPNKYDISAPLRAAYSFGLKLDKIAQKSGVPGPGQYTLKKIPKSPHYSFGVKIYETKPEFRLPSFSTYHPNDTLVKNNRFNNIGFGVSQRFQDHHTTLNPGPGTYNLASKFDKVKQ